MPNSDTHAHVRSHSGGRSASCKRGHPGSKLGVTFCSDVLLSHGHVRRAVPDPGLKLGQGGSQLRSQRRTRVA